MKSVFGFTLRCIFWGLGFLLVFKESRLFLFNPFGISYFKTTESTEVWLRPNYTEWDCGYRTEILIFPEILPQLTIIMSVVII